MTTESEKIKEGCGKEFDWDTNMPMICGEEYCGEVRLCDDCEGKITTAEKIKEGCYKRWGEDDEMICLGTEGTLNIHGLCPTCQARLSQYKSDLQQELKFLKKSFCNKCCSSCMYNVEGRIIEIEKELQEIET